MKTMTPIRNVTPRVRSDRRSSKKAAVRKILVPVDFSTPSFRAIDHAVSIARRFNAAVDLVHVFEPAYPLAGIAGMPLYLPDSDVGPRVRRHLRDVAVKHNVLLTQNNIHVIDGRPFEEICRLARMIDADLIIIPTRGNTGLKHLTLGSTAERVVRYSPCPVLVLRGSAVKKTGGNGKSKPAMLTFRRIVVPIDFSECSMKGLNYAIGLAREFGSTLVLLHSVYPQYYVTNDEYARFDFPLLTEQTENAARKQMQELVTKTDWAGIKVEPVLETGHAGEQICDRAKDRNADLIVTSTHGRTGLKHAFLGSTAEYVVRHAPTPVLVVPSHERPSLR